MHFGIWCDSDSFFVGRKPGRWVGIHIDHWWSEDVKCYGAPLASYIHWWPGKCWVWRWPRTKKAKARDEARFEKLWSGPVFRSSGFRACCAVEGCEWKADPGSEREPLIFYILRRSTHYRGGVDIELGETHVVVCPEHAAAGRRLRVKLLPGKEEKLG